MTLSNSEQQSTRRNHIADHSDLEGTCKIRGRGMVIGHVWILLVTTDEPHDKAQA